MKKLYIVFMCLISSYLVAEILDVKKSNGIGLAVGEVSSHGFSYLKMADKYGFQVSFLYTHSGESISFPDSLLSYGSLDCDSSGRYLKKINMDISSNVGLLFIRILSRTKHSLGGNAEFYVFSGGSFYYDYEKETRQYYSQPYYNAPYEKEALQREIESIKKRIVLGAGLGISGKFMENVRVALEMPYRYIIRDNRSNIDFKYPQLSIHYCF
jgi:hypothetical protein